MFYIIIFGSKLLKNRYFISKIGSCNNMVPMLGDFLKEF
jgi:hypothetical protein